MPTRERAAYPYSPSSARSETSTCITTPDRSPQHAIPGLPPQPWKEAVLVHTAREDAMTMPGGGPLLDASSGDGLGFWASTPPPDATAEQETNSQSVQAPRRPEEPVRPARPARPEHCRETLEDLDEGSHTPSAGVVSLRSMRKPPAQYYHPAPPVAPSETSSTFKLAPAPQRARAATASARTVERSSMDSTATFVSARSEMSFSTARARRLPQYPPSASRSSGLPQQQPIPQPESSPEITRRPSLLKRLADGLRRSPSQFSDAVTIGPTDYAKIPRTPMEMIAPYPSDPSPAPTLSRKLSFSKRSPTPTRIAQHGTTEDAVVGQVPPRALARKLSFSQTSPSTQLALHRTMSLRSNPPPCSNAKRSPSRTSIVQAASTPPVLGAKKVTFALATSTTAPARTLSRCR
ncbi:hypothetical protein L1887_60337 [Cichorium endivia]|nr:hypothetical protein L1887_60337 [Cichorium endivia]